MLKTGDIIEREEANQKFIRSKQEARRNMEALNYPESKERIEPEFPKKEERGRWSEIVPEIPYYSSLQRYLDFSQQFYFALPVNSVNYPVINNRASCFIHRCTTISKKQ